MDVFNKYKTQLKEFQYPNINAFNDEQIQDIFLPKNRLCLLTWLIMNLNSQMVDVDGLKLSENAVGDFLTESGFCTTSQRQQFVQGTSNFSVQVKIFDRIFEYLGQIQTVEEVNSSSSTEQQDDIDNFLAKDINLFPAFGSIRTYTPEEREHKLLTYVQDIDNFNKKIDFNLTKTYNEIKLNDTLFENDNINKNLNNFKQLAEDLGGMLSFIKEKETQVTEVETFNFPQNFADDLRRCCEEMSPVLQYFNNVSLTREIQQGTQDSLHNKFDNGTPELLKHQAESFNDTVRLLK